MSLKARIEAVIYAAEEPVTLAQLASLFRDEAVASRAARLAQEPEPEADAIAAQEPAEGEPGELALVEQADGEQSGGEQAARQAARARERETREEIRRLVDELIADYNAPDRGLEIREVAGGFRIGTRPEVHDAVHAFVKSLKPPFRLSLQALETLAVIAYKQPVTAPEIGDIRGVDSSGVLGSLIARKLITTAGRKAVVGRPILYKTTREFLLRFGLRDLNELPSIEEFEKMASELEESEAEPESGAAEEDLPFAQNEIAEIEENAPQDAEGRSPSAQDEAPTSEQDAAVEEPQP